LKGEGEPVTWFAPTGPVWGMRSLWESIAGRGRRRRFDLLPGWDTRGGGLRPLSLVAVGLVIRSRAVPPPLT